MISSLVLFLAAMQSPAAIDASVACITSQLSVEEGIAYLNAGPTGNGDHPIELAMARATDRCASEHSWTADSSGRFAWLARVRFLREVASIPLTRAQIDPQAIDSWLESGAGRDSGSFEVAFRRLADHLSTIADRTAVAAHRHDIELYASAWIAMRSTERHLQEEWIR